MPYEPCANSLELSTNELLTLGESIESSWSPEGLRLVL